MIRAGLTSLLFAYAGVFLAAVLVLWLIYGQGRARRRHRDRAGLFQCRLCAEWIRHREPQGLVRCSSCGAINEQPMTGNDI